MGEKGILIVGHGSRSGSNESAVIMHTEYLRNKGYGNVFHSFKGYSRPYVQDVIVEMAEKGIDDVTVVPLFIAKGHYADEVVPRRVDLNKGENEGISDINGRKVKIRITETFGCQDGTSEIIVKMIRGAEIEGKKNGALLIGHGSRGTENKRMVMFNVENVQKAGKKVYAAFNDFNDPTVEDALDEMIKDDIEHIIVVPVFVSSGEHTGKDLPDRLGLKDDKTHGIVEAEGRTASVAYLDPVGSRPEVGTIIEAMIRKYL